MQTPLDISCCDIEPACLVNGLFLAAKLIHLQQGTLLKREAELGVQWP
jgi:hypothetical protein